LLVDFGEEIEHDQIMVIRASFESKGLAAIQSSIEMIGRLLIPSDIPGNSANISIDVNYYGKLLTELILLREQIQHTQEKISE